MSADRRATATDARGCKLRAVRASGSRVVTVRGYPVPSGVLTWRTPSPSAMARLARSLASESEAPGALREASPVHDGPGAPWCASYYARRPL